MANFASRLKELRSELGLTQQELSTKLGISCGAVGNYESGMRSPRFEDLENIADFFNVETDFLLGRSDFRPEYSMEEMWIIDCYRNITEDSVRDAIKLLLKQYSPNKKEDSLSSVG